MSEVVESTEHLREWGYGRFGQGGEGCGRNNQSALIDKVTVTLVYTDDLAEVVSILNDTETVLSDSVVRKVVVHGGPWKQDSLPLTWELFFEQGGFSPHVKYINRGCACSRPSLSVLTPGSGIESASGNLRGVKR